MKQSIKDKILNAKLKRKTIFIPEWDTDIIIQEPNGIERAEYEIFCANAGTDDNVLKEIRGQVAAKCIVDNDGNRIFSDDEIKELHLTSANALDRVIQGYRDLSESSDEEIQQTAKN